MSTTHERIVNSQENIAGVQDVLDHAQSVLAAAETVEVAASKNRGLIKMLLLLTVLGVVAFVAWKLLGGDSDEPEPEGA